MSAHLFERLIAAKTPEEEMHLLLAALPPVLSQAVWVAAIPHWFNSDVLAALLPNHASEAVDLYQQLQNLSFVEPYQGRGHNVHELAQDTILKLWQETRLDEYIQVSKLAATYFATQKDGASRIEAARHLAQVQSVQNTERQPLRLVSSTGGERILVIDDDESALWLIGSLLQHNGLEVLKAASPTEGLKIAREQKPNLILLNVMMPEMDGWEVCRRLRDMSDVPIVFTTARNAIKDVVKGLEVGGDDYIVKPFDNRELVARVKAHLRRRLAEEKEADEMSFSNGDLKINFRSREVHVRNQLVELTPKEFSLLALLAKNAGRLLTRSELIAQAWGPEYSEANESLKLYIQYLRKKIERNPEKPDFIITSRGIGYRFVSK